jgi:hypothetical protein
MKTPYLFLRSPAIALIFSLVYGMGAPAIALAAESLTNSDGTITPSTLLVDSGAKVRLSGTASDATKVRFEVTASETSKKVIAKSKNLTVSGKEKWGGSLSKKLKDGTYHVNVYAVSGSKKKEIATGTLVVGKPAAILSVSSIPLLSGSFTSAGTIVPISYLQIRNQSSSTVPVKGFWVNQTGSAVDASIIGFSSVDDKGGSRSTVGGAEGSKVLSKGKAYIPSTAVLAPGERKLFTLKAQLSTNATQYSGTAFTFNVTGVDAAATFKNTFPILGTTWTISR